MREASARSFLSSKWADPSVKIDLASFDDLLEDGELVAAIWHVAICSDDACQARLEPIKEFLAFTPHYALTLVGALNSARRRIREFESKQKDLDAAPERP